MATKKTTIENGEPKKAIIGITAPDFARVRMSISGTAPLMVAAFSQKAQNEIRSKHEAGSQSKKGAAKEARDFSADCNGARHISIDGWDGINAAAFRQACVSACRLVNFKMTLAKLSLFVKEDGFDVVSGVPLIRIISPDPYEESVMPTRNANGGFDLRARPMWRNWGMVLTIEFDRGIFSLQDVVNLMTRVGMQVGIGEGRPDSRASAGMGFGTFRVEEDIQQL
jgi:hypothetical protein